MAWPIYQYHQTLLISFLYSQPQEEEEMGQILSDNEHRQFSFILAKCIMITLISSFSHQSSGGTGVDFSLFKDMGIGKHKLSLFPISGLVRPLF